MVDSATPAVAASAAPEARALLDRARSRALSTSSRGAGLASGAEASAAPSIFFDWGIIFSTFSAGSLMNLIVGQRSSTQLALGDRFCFCRPMLPSDSRIETRAVHAGMGGLGGSHVPTIELSTTNPLPNVELGGDSYEQLATGGPLLDGQSAVYQRLWQPGVARFEESLAALEGAEVAVAYSTGMAALSACLLAAASAGKPHVVALRPLYGGTDHVLDAGLPGRASCRERVEMSGGDVW